MDYGICNLSLVPVRAEPSDKSELVTQLVYGECYQLVSTQGNWHQIQIAADGYVGWIDFKQHCPVTAAYYKEWFETPHPRTLDIVQTISGAGSCVPVMIGSTLPFSMALMCASATKSTFTTGRQRIVRFLLILISLPKLPLVT